MGLCKSFSIQSTASDQSFCPDSSSEGSLQLLSTSALSSMLDATLRLQGETTSPVSSDTSYGSPPVQASPPQSVRFSTSQPWHGEGIERDPQTGLPAAPSLGAQQEGPARRCQRFVEGRPNSMERAPLFCRQNSIGSKRDSKQQLSDDDKLSFDTFSMADSLVSDLSSWSDFSESFTSPSSPTHLCSRTNSWIGGVVQKSPS